jgi:hypothetical protein
MMPIVPSLAGLRYFIFDPGTAVPGFHMPPLRGLSCIYSILLAQ